MARDAELDRLKAAQDLAFQRKQNAYQAMQSAWDRLSTIRNDLDRSHEKKQRAYSVQDSLWQDYQRTRSANGPRIDQLNSMQERAYENMKNAFNSASDAHGRRDGASARMYADDGHRYKSEAQGYVAERRRLVEDIKSVKVRFEAAKLTFQQAKEEFSSVKRQFDQSKSDYDRAQGEFKQAKASFDNAAKTFRERLEAVRDQNKQRHNDKRAIAQKAGVPYQYLDDVYISRDLDGAIQIYFGGIGAPDGPGHGHYSINRNGDVTYKRDPFDPHGAKNFTDSNRDYYELIGREASATGDFGIWCRFRGYDAYVESNINKQGRHKIDVYYGPNGPFGPGHHHAVAYRETPFDFISDKLR